MKKMNKKGFTIVELVIVIAVIAILAAVMIPTFSGVVQNAKETAALQEARSIYNELAAYELSDGEWNADYAIESGDYYFVVTDGELDTQNPVKADVPTDAYTSVTYDGVEGTIYTKN